MSGPELCDKCGGFHYRRAPCIIRNTAASKIIEGLQEALAVAKGDAEPYAVHKRGPGRPKTITDMAAYKASKQREYRARSKASKPIQ